MVLTEGNPAALGIGFGVAGHVMFVWRGGMSIRRSILSPSVVPPLVTAKTKIAKKDVCILLPGVKVMNMQIADDGSMRRRLLLRWVYQEERLFRTKGYKLP
jgi:hypothetical protein